ncbi:MULTISPECIES: glycoside hydrolase family 13 protein [unclassified Arthrobacter]|uniref:glycoside hydrolase family 13 protein n=1 Tax=unclassified Arthrobacter TaxID=235627 RepID=UPI001E36AD61|nr:MULTISPECIES: glycoside hydrolase family 13 protein [unclassified Arthrobacter]MCC9145820.1 glycoside hydrolase family 13 protein [Arthrobacter sp. zg-Y919]MDK1277049.1 glycoside hydrolase family 13 protein [Arthrobacter sp. zg.Y919]WIB03578.1 glycoside hydrolase family 13 protein [Arthrobacter sp. zg-Y919]
MFRTVLDDSLTELVPVHPASTGREWWRSSVIYQIYPRSFRDLNGDGIGDLPGITAEIPTLAELDIDAIWLSPFYRSPQKDAGYDVADYCSVDPLFGTLDDFDALVAEASRHNIRIIVDLVPNHCSDQHPLFQAALASPAGSPARDLFIFRDGTGEHGENPPNNWQSHFGGPAWTRVTEPDGTPGQWYLHLFDTSQPDFNWDSPAVHAEFEKILRFWLDRGVGGFRVDVAHALIKKSGLPDWGGRADGSSSEGFPGHAAPMFGQPGIHDIYRSWRKILDSYDGDRVLCAEATIDPIERLSDWVRPDEMHQTFNFSYLHHPWHAPALRHVIESSLRAFDSVGAPTTWVLSNHDVVRHTSRFGQTGWQERPGDGIGAADTQPDHHLGITRARAATLLMLALPGGVYLYQGEELGLPDHTQMDHAFRQDPTYHRTAGERLGRDGCRVPLPWTPDGPAFGFNGTGESWLPQPQGWGELARGVQREDPDSTLNLYRIALDLRRELDLGNGSLAWWPGYDSEQVLAFANGNVIAVMNMGGTDVELPAGELIACSRNGAVWDGYLLPDCSAWVRVG